MDAVRRGNRSTANNAGSAVTSGLPRGVVGRGSEGVGGGRRKSAWPSIADSARRRSFKMARFKRQHSLNYSNGTYNYHEAVGCRRADGSGDRTRWWRLFTRLLRKTRSDGIRYVDARVCDMRTCIL